MSDDILAFWSAFKAAGMLDSAVDGAGAFDVSLSMPDADRFGRAVRSREYIIEYEFATRPALAVGDELTIADALYKVREAPYIPEGGNAATGQFRHAVLTLVGPAAESAGSRAAIESDALATFWPAFDAAGMLLVASDDDGDWNVSLAKPDVDKLGRGVVSREYEIEYQYSDRPQLAAGDQLSIGDDTFTVREAPYIPHAGNSATGTYRCALLTRVEAATTYRITSTGARRVTSTGANRIVS